MMKTRASFEQVLWLLVAAASMAAPSGAAAFCPPDLNGDGVVDDADQALILAVVGPVDPDDPAQARADLNGNGHVCDGDLLMLADHWGPCTSCPADLNGDGQVTADDRQLLEAAYGRPCGGNLGRFGSVGEKDLDILILSLSPSDGSEPHPDADPRADLNSDGTIDTVDEQLLIAAMGTDCRPDLSSDGRVDADDLWWLLNAWGPCPSSAASGETCNFRGDPPKQCDPKGDLP